MMAAPSPAPAVWRSTLHVLTIELFWTQTLTAASQFLTQEQHAALCDKARALFESQEDLLDVLREQGFKMVLLETR